MLTDGDILLKNIDRVIYNTLRPLGDQIVQNVPPMFRSMVDVDGYIELVKDYAIKYIEPYVRQLEGYKLKKSGSKNFELNEVKYVTKEIMEEKLNSIFERMESEYKNE